YSGKRTQLHRSQQRTDGASSVSNLRYSTTSAAPQSSNRCVQETGGAADSASSGALVASITGLRQKRVQYPVEHYRVAPADLDVEHFDAGPQTRMQPHPILCGREELRVSSRCRFVQPRDVLAAIGVMISEGVRRD